MRLYFLRHGRAVARDEWGGDDAQRPLTEDGVELVRAEADSLRRMALDPTVIITSPLVRAVQTADIVVERLDLSGRLLHDDRMAAGLDLDTLQELVRENDHAAAILFVGHEPDFSEIISGLTGGKSIVMKKGALARVDLPDHSVRRGHLVWLIPSAALAR